MLRDYFKFNFTHKEKRFDGFCMKIQDDFHQTYAVMLNGYRSFCIWMDDKTSTWQISKNVEIDKETLKLIINKIALG